VDEVAPGQVSVPSFPLPEPLLCAKLVFHSSAIALSDVSNWQRH